MLFNYGVGILSVTICTAFLFYTIPEDCYNQ